jgi:hypothetical protein
MPIFMTYNIAVGHYPGADWTPFQELYTPSSRT